MTDLRENLKRMVELEKSFGSDFIPGCRVNGREDEMKKPVNGGEPLTGEDIADDRAVQLEEFREEVGECLRCPLGSTRTNMVFGEGNPRTRVMFVGEAPGRDEDRQGRPFVGRAGVILTDIIEKGMGLSRSEVYIANILKCRPPNNRNPLPLEMERCFPYLLRQMEIIRPEIIVCLGAVPARALLDTKEPIGKIRGIFNSFRGIKLMVTYHPAYLLRNPSAKRLVWEDIKKVMTFLGISIPEAGR